MGHPKCCWLFERQWQIPFIFEMGIGNLLMEVAVYRVDAAQSVVKKTQSVLRFLRLVY